MLSQMWIRDRSHHWSCFYFKLSQDLCLPHHFMSAIQMFTICVDGILSDKALVMCALVPVGTYRGQRKLALLYHFLPYSFETKSFPKSRDHTFWFHWQPASPSELPMSSLHGSGVTGTGETIPNCSVETGDHTQVCMIVSHGYLCPSLLSLLSSPLLTLYQFNSTSFDLISFSLSFVSQLHSRISQI